MDVPEPKQATPLSAIPRWSALEGEGPDPPEHPLGDKEQAANGPGPQPSAQRPSVRFPCRLDLNRKIALWKGPLVQLAVDAIVNSSNEPLTDMTGLAQQIFREAGPELLQEVYRLEGCRTGEAKITKGYNLPARHVLHTVGPRFNLKYKTAAENALHNCYRSCLQVLKESGLRTLAFQVINSERRGYPPDNGAHIAIRTVRRFLERYGADIELVVFCMDRDEDVVLYSGVLPLYFPRSPAEEQKVQALLPDDTGNENGETFIEERKIRIAATPVLSSAAAASAPVPVAVAGASGRGPQGEREEEEEEEAQATRLFGSMQGDPDHKQQQRSAVPESDEARLYASLVRRARSEDLSEVARRQVFYQSGTDRGRSVFVLLSANLPSDEREEDRALVYITKVMAGACERPHVVLFFVDPDQQPPFGWLKQLLGLWDAHWSAHLHAFYVLHAGLWFRLLLGMARLTVSDRLAARLVLLDSLREAHALVDHAQLKLPERVVRADQRLNDYTYTVPPNGAPAPAPAASSSSLASAQAQPDLEL